MDLSQKGSSLMLLVVAVGCIQLYQAHDLTGRCSCETTVKFIKENITDFLVLEKRPGCARTELIVTVAYRDNSTQRLCMDTDKKMARALLKCWENRNKDESRKMECINKFRVKVQDA